jgi:hypothetical protein
MGGNALKSCTRRYQKDEFSQLTTRVIAELKALLKTRVELIPYYTNKDSFGDADLLVELDSLPPNWKQVVTSNYCDTFEQFASNGEVLSIAVDELQVDLIAIQSKYFKAAKDYFSFNDLHNLTGRLLHKLGIKHGHKGLSIVVRSKERNDHILAELELETDNAKAKAYEILGLDPNFVPDTFEDIFKFVTSSKYFDPDIYLLENRNNVSRTRDRKRKVYGGMLEYCRQNPGSKKYNFPEKNERGGYSLREPYYTEIVLKHWPEVGPKVDQIIEDFELNLEFHKVFNGNLVSEWSGLTGKELGAFIAKVKEELKPVELYVAHPESVERIVKKCLTEWAK